MQEAPTPVPAVAGTAMLLPRAASDTADVSWGWAIMVGDIAAVKTLIKSAGHEVNAVCGYQK